MKLKKDKKGRVQVPAAFGVIKKKDLLPGDILLFYGSNKLTKWHGKNRKKKLGRSKNPPTHAAIVYKRVNFDVFILDQELRGTLSFLHEYSKQKSLRIDVVRPEGTEPMVLIGYARSNVQKHIKKIATKEKLYDWKGYGAFASQMPYFGWMFKWVKPSKDTFYCSDVASYVWQTEGVQVSPRGHNYTAPVDIQLFAMKNDTIHTLKLEGEVI